MPIKRLTKAAKELCATDAQLSDFILVLIPFNNTQGYIHKDFAAPLLAAEIDGVKLKHGKVVIGENAAKASDVTDVLARITEHFIEQKLIKTTDEDKGENARVAPEWNINPWNKIKNRTPVCHPKTAQLLGIPIYSSQFILKTHSPKPRFWFGIRNGGKMHGFLDVTAGGKHQAELSARANAETEIQQETGRKATKLDCIGSTNLPEIRGRRYLNRHMHIYVGELDGTPTPTREVQGYKLLCARAFANALKGEWRKKYGAHIPHVIAFYLEHLRQPLRGVPRQRIPPPAQIQAEI